MSTVSLPLPTVELRRCARAAAAATIWMAVAVFAVHGLAMAAGFRVLIDRSDSMLPALAAGDLVVTRMTPARMVGVGEIVTFADSARGGELLTHRVVGRTPRGASLDFVTRGDANTGVEKWAIARDGMVGRFALRIPKAGFALSYLAMPQVRLTLVALGAGGLAVAALRRIWTS